MNRRAMTLPELLLTVVLLGILAAIGVPRLAATADHAALRATRSQLLRALDAGRGAAVRLGRPVEVVAADGALTVAQSTELAPLWQSPGPGHLGVTLTGLSTPIRFGPSGITTGVANRTLRLRKGGDTVEVVVSRLGRIR